MPKQSAGLLMFREVGGQVEVLLAHPGGPFWAKKDDGAWSLPKGEFEADEEALVAARREFAEETGASPEGDFLPLESVRQSSGKIVHAWAIRGDFDSTALRSNTFSMEWPPRSGQQQEFPEVDRVAWFSLSEASVKIMKSQLPFLARLESISKSA